MLVDEVAPGLWSAESRVRFVGQWVPLRMSVVRLRDGSLVVHSPIQTSGALTSTLAAFGPVRHLVAPSKYHHLWMQPWVQQYPNASVYGAPGLAEKREHIRFDHELSDEAPAAWATEMDQLVFRGLPMFNEVVFLHRASRTLIVTDLVFHIHQAEGALAPWIMRLNGMWQTFGPSRALRAMLRLNRRAARNGIRSILAWDFDRIVMSHGRILESGGPQALQRAFSFLL